MEITIRAAVARVAARNSELRAIATPTLAAALERAAAPSAGARGPLDGVPYCLKDTWDTRGLRTAGGSWRYRHRVPALSGAVHLAFERAGAVLIGKSNVPDLALVPECDNYLVGRTANPHDLARTSGGSTGGGAAAVADGMAAFDWGSDSGGSIRLPSAFCGIAGVRLASRYWPPVGHFPPHRLGLWLNGMGPLARSVAACRAIIDAVAPALRQRRGPAFTATGAAILDVDAFARGAWGQFGDDARRLLARAGIAVQPAALPSPRAADRAYAWLIGSRFHRMFAGQPFELGSAVVSALTLGPWLGDRRVHPATGRVIATLAVARATIYRSARAADARVARVQEAVRAVWERQCVIVTPTTTFPAPLHGRALATRGLAAFAKLGNLVDATAVAIPCGRFPSGMPRSIQVLGPPGSEDATLEVAERIERAAHAMYGPPPRPPVAARGRDL